jgi:hypothetical protein
MVRRIKWFRSIRIFTYAIRGGVRISAGFYGDARGIDQAWRIDVPNS